MLAIKNAKIVLEDRIEEGKVLLFSDKIEKITDNIPEGYEVIDAHGGTLPPALSTCTYTDILVRTFAMLMLIVLKLSQAALWRTVLRAFCLQQ